MLGLILKQCLTDTGEISLSQLGLLLRYYRQVAGVLYIVGTPIGNLDDLSIRAAKILRSVAAVACEDTRQTAKLMAAAAAHRPLLSLHEHNEQERTQELVDRMLSGDDLALVSDAGTPLISDPGFRLVEAAAAAGIRVSPIPGPSAVLSALSVSGLPTDHFAFIGFLPHKAVARQKLLETWGRIEATLVFFESPHRILETLDEIATQFPARQLAVGRELTKLYEEVLRGNAASIAATLRSRPAIKGEFTLVMARESGETSEANLSDPVQLKGEVARLIDAGSSRMDAIKQVAKRAGLNKRDAYDLLEKGKDAR